MSETENTSPFHGARYCPEGETIDAQTGWRMQIEEPDGAWVHLGMVRTDRDEMTRVQADHIRRYPDQRHRILRVTTEVVVEEVAGDGAGETSQAEILKRNEETTARILAEEAGPASE